MELSGGSLGQSTVSSCCCSFTGRSLFLLVFLKCRRPAAQVFDDKATFAEWFGDALGKGAGGAGGGGGAGAGDEWLETEKRVVVIHRLHQILEPFMLRRQVADVEGRLPPKVPPLLNCAATQLLQQVSFPLHR